MLRLPIVTEVLQDPGYYQKRLFARTSIAGFIPLACSSCLKIGLFICFPITRMLFSTSQLFHNSAAVWTIGKTLHGLHTVSWVLNFLPHGALQVMIESSTFIKYAFSFWFFCPVWVLLWCRFQILPKKQVLTLLPVIIKPFPAGSGALIRSYPAHPGESGGESNMCWVVILLYLCSPAHQGKKTKTVNLKQHGSGNPCLWGNCCTIDLL